ncbi:hypothetical protein BKH46_08290 [Helicobacter sp. 12S02634-8]|uniref:hypothetical protein n=1 Tax=Helicobacter sp. 12S02634-8 TaxID=1476199 RepID=UPI000BA53841|nr:hypothetical protein [Helicobacter sp. 12S02634-8]PAF46229.1 hypothetical protein BKH46_08290 [Helicobacter sp. 12S02634-8]
MKTLVDKEKRLSYKESIKEVDFNETLFMFQILDLERDLACKVIASSGLMDKSIMKEKFESPLQYLDSIHTDQREEPIVSVLRKICSKTIEYLKELGFNFSGPVKIVKDNEAEDTKYRQWIIELTEQDRHALSVFEQTTPLPTDPTLHKMLSHFMFYAKANDADLCVILRNQRKEKQ